MRDQSAAKMRQIPDRPKEELARTTIKFLLQIMVATNNGLHLYRLHFYSNNFLLSKFIQHTVTNQLMADVWLGSIERLRRMSDVLSGVENSEGKSV